VSARGTIRVLVVASGPGTAPLLTRAVDLAPGVELAGEVDVMRAMAGLRPACDAFLVVGDPAVVRELAAASPGIPAVLVGGDPDGAHLRAAMSAGARGVVPADPRPEELAASLLDAVGASVPAQERSRDGRVIAVCGAKGGVGATTVAVGLTSIAGGMLVDAAAGHGTLAGHVGCHPQRSLADLARLAGSVGADALAAVRTEHPGGMGVVAGLSEPDLVGLLPSGLGAALARECRAVAGTTVFDLGRPGSPFAIETARCTDAVALVLTPDAFAATAAAATIGTLVRRGVDPDAILLIVNRWRSGDALPLRAIEATAGAQVLGVVREDARGADRFSNSGILPAVRRRGLGRDLSVLVDRLAR
jgi:pilus assembly protein CpaE